MKRMIGWKDVLSEEKMMDLDMSTSMIMKDVLSEENTA